MTSEHTTRETWLVEAVSLIKSALFDPRELWLPPIIRVSPGLCPGKALGICVDSDCAKDGSCNIFVSPTLDDPMEILAVLAHELVHACVGNECKHGGLFLKTFRDIGFECKPTNCAVLPDQELYHTLMGVAVSLGVYPHAQLIKKVKEKKRHKWLSFSSTTNDEFIVRANYDTVVELGPPRDHTGEPMVPKDPDAWAELEQQAEQEEKEKDFLTVVVEELEEAL